MRRVWSGPMSKKMYTVCAYRIVLQDMTHSTDFRDPEGTRATTLNVDILVNMA